MWRHLLPSSLLLSGVASAVPARWKTSHPPAAPSLRARATSTRRLRNGVAADGGLGLFTKSSPYRSGPSQAQGCLAEGAWLCDMLKVEVIVLKPTPLPRQASESGTVPVWSTPTDFHGQCKKRAPRMPWRCNTWRSTPRHVIRPPPLQ